MTKHPCAGLSKVARETFERIAIRDDTGVFGATPKALMKRGLIESYLERLPARKGEPAWLAITVTRYRVPLPVHAQWCQWCAEQEGQ